MQAAQVILETLKAWGQEHTSPSELRLVIYERALVKAIAEHWGAWLT
jgi:hypothetical protein